MKILEANLTQQDLERLVNREYDFYPHSVEVFGTTRKISCDRGVFSLKQSNVTIDQLVFLEQVFKHLQEKKFPHFLPFVPNKFGDTFVTIKGNHYYVTPWIEDHVEEKYREQWEFTIARGMGKLHATTLQLGETVYNHPPLFIHSLLKRWKARLREMKEYKQFAESREMMSPIELSYIHHFNYLLELGTRAIRYLTQWQEKTKDIPTRITLCHGNIHRKNVVHDQEQFYFIHFDQANFETPFHDVALFLRRHLNKLLDQKEEVALDWLREYEQEFPLQKEERILLAIFLLFPERVFKEIEVYYQGIRDWHPHKQLKYFEKQIHLTKKIRRFVKILVSQNK